MSASIAVRLSQRWWLFLCWCITAVLPASLRLIKAIPATLPAIRLVAPLVVDIAAVADIRGNGEAFFNFISVFVSFAMIILCTDEIET